MAGQRKVIFVFTAGDVGEYVQTTIATWREEYARDDKRALIEAWIQAQTQVGDRYSFVVAVDSETGGAVLLPAHAGAEMLRRTRDAQTLPFDIWSEEPNIGG